MEQTYSVTPSFLCVFTTSIDSATRGTSESNFRVGDSFCDMLVNNSDIFLILGLAYSCNTFSTEAKSSHRERTVPCLLAQWHSFCLLWCAEAYSCIHKNGRGHVLSTKLFWALSRKATSIFLRPGCNTLGFREVREVVHWFSLREYEEENRICPCCNAYKYKQKLILQTCFFVQCCCIGSNTMWSTTS